MFSMFSDSYFMKLALQEAVKASENGEVPVGAVLVSDLKVIARGYNQTEALQDITAHAEIIAITSASQAIGSKYLQDCTLYVTLEPCVMCAGALYWSQVSRVVIGASDEKRGFLRFGKELLHPKTKLELGIMEEECSKILTDFFKNKR
jgi:tRNA(adenine34) deaminase